MTRQQPSFGVGERAGHWWFLAPDGEPFWSIGMNHIDSAALRHAETVHIWRDKYGNSEQRWIRKAVAPDLRDWGFNTIGWTQEVVLRSPAMHRHSRSFTYEEYRWADMPYCHLLPFTETHQWEKETRHPDVFSEGFEAWCDYVARKECARMAEDAKLGLPHERWARREAPRRPARGPAGCERAVARHFSGLPAEFSRPQPPREKRP